MRINRPLGAIVAAASALALSPALASDLYVQGQVAEPVLAPVAVPQRSVLLGLGVGFAPAYEGSDEFRIAPFPIIAPDFGGDGPRRFEFRGLDDIRLHLVRFGPVSLGPLAGYDFGRDEDIDDRLVGLGDIDGGLVVGGFVSAEVFATDVTSVSIDAAISTQVTGDAFDEDRFANLPNLRTRFDTDYGYGYEVDFGASLEQDVTRTLNLAARVGAVYADDEYMRTQFGISALQAANSAALGAGLPAFDTDAGIKNVYVRTSATLDVTPRIQLRAGVGYSRLLDDAADSPVTANENQLSGNIGAAYRIAF